MSKIKIKTSLKNQETQIEKTLKGIKNKNKITFLEENIRVNIYLENNLITMIRKTEEYQLTLKFQKFLTIEGKYDIKDIGRLDVKTKTLDLIIKENKLYIKYILYINHENLGYNTYKLEYEEIA